MKKSSSGAFLRTRKAILAASLSIVVIITCMIYIVHDAISLQLSHASPYYVFAIITSSLALYYNRKGKFNYASNLILYPVLVVVFVFTASEPFNTGNYINFFPLIMAAFALRGYKGLKQSLTFSIIALIAFLCAIFLDINFLPGRSYDNFYIQLNFVLHFVTALVAMVLIVFFTTKINYHVRKKLKKSEFDLKNLAKALEASNQRFELAIRGSNAGIWDWDILENKVYHSPIWKEMLGYEETELNNIGVDDFFEMIHPDDKARVRERLEAHLKKNDPYKEEFRMMTKLGTYKWFIDSGQSVWDHNMNPIRMVGSLIDITKRKIAEEKILNQNRVLEKTNEELDRFVYSASHDIRAPLLSILGLINIAESTKDVAEIQHCLDLMANRVNRLDEFVGDIIDYSKNSKLKLEPEPISIRSIIEKLLEDLLFIENADRLEINIQDGVKEKVYLDRTRMTIILKNLISNAIKYQNKFIDTPKLNIRTSIENGILELVIEDNGIGINAALQEKVFDMFYRATERSKGSGLGLYIVKEVIEKMNGDISLTSKEGEGTRFVIMLPVFNPKSLALT